MEICFIHGWARSFVEPPNPSREEDLHQILQIEIYYMESAADPMDGVLYLKKNIKKIILCKIIFDEV